MPEKNKRREEATPCVPRGGADGMGALDCSRPGKPTDHASIEAFNARLRAEGWNASWFFSMHDAKDRIERWRQDYNTARPHSALDNVTPNAFARQAHEARKIA